MSVHREPHRTSVPGHGTVTHVPDSQTWSGVHALPQLPQLKSSNCVSTQSGPQHIKPAGHEHGMTHEPAEQYSVELQRVKQSPQ